MPLFWVSLAFLVGALSAASLSLPTAVWIGLATLALLPPLLPRLAPILQSRYPAFTRLRLPPLPGRFPYLPTLLSGWLSLLPPKIPFSLLPLCLLLGAARYQSAQPSLNPNSLAWYNDQVSDVELEGILVKPPDERDTYTNLRLRVDSLRALDALDSTLVQGQLLARVSPGGDWRYGDRLRLQGHLLTPTEDETFSYRDYLAISGIYSYMAYPQATRLERGVGNPFLAGLYAFHERAVKVLYRIFPDPEASLMAGILLSEPQGIPAEVQSAFRLTGASHIIAISGFNITLVASLFTVVFSRVWGFRRGAIAAALGIGLYVLLVGATASVVRAALLGWLTLLGRQAGRRQVGLNSLAFAGALMTLSNPLVLWDAGFQLSFSATLGLILYMQPFSTAFTKWIGRWLPASTTSRLTQPVGEYFLTTLAAQVTLLPVILVHFQQFPLTSLLVNPLILPAQPPIMLLGGLALGLGLISAPLGQAAALLTWPFTAYTIRIVELFAQVPGGVLHTGSASGIFVVSFYVILFVITFFRFKLATLTRKLMPAGAILGMGLLAVLTWRAAFLAPDGRLHVTLLDVGTGESLLIQTPNGRYVLVNGGASPSQLSDGLGRRLPLVNRRLDWLIVASPDNQDLSALSSTIERFNPAYVLWSGPTGGTRAARSLYQTLTASSTPVTFMQSGQRLDLGSGASLQALSVGARGAVLLVEWQAFRLLLPLGLDFDTLETLEYGRNLGRLSALLLAESGYAPLNPPEWITNLSPQTVLLSVAPGDPENLPSPETLTAIQGYTLLRTDQNGWIEMVTDGQQMWVQVERGKK
jgi:competence protein ComEC